MLRYLPVLILIALTALPCMVSAQAHRVQVSDLVFEALRNPRTLIAMAIQFAMGLGLGYFSAKAVKYVIALLLILVLGTVLSVWSIGASPEAFLGQLYEAFRQLQPQIIALLQLLGIMTVGPVSLGFIVGVVIALVRR